MKEKTETYKLQRDDGSIFAVVDTYVDDGDRFVKINVVEDSDWLHIEDMQQLAIQLNTIVLKLQYQDDKALMSLDK